MFKGAGNGPSLLTVTRIPLFGNLCFPDGQLGLFTGKQHLPHRMCLLKVLPCFCNFAVQGRNDPSVKVQTRVVSTCRQSVFRMHLRLSWATRSGQRPCDCVVRKNVLTIS